MIDATSGPRRRWLLPLLLAVIVTLFAARNLPWHLDDLDQAKQAFTSFEMVHLGHWDFQHTPTGRIATKPPLAGWISAALYLAMGSHGWELAWRLPPFVCALILLRFMWKGGAQFGASSGALIAVSAFGLNLLTPRLATLVRTDMMLTLCIFIPGWLVLEKVRKREAWRTSERWLVFAAVLASMLTKGPIAFAFLLPGLVAFALLTRRREQPLYTWSGAWSWFAPLLVFGAWAGYGIWQSPEFYDQVVRREFFGRFDMSDAPVHKHQPLWFYFAHLLHKWSPWSLGLLALVSVKRVRTALREDPEILWLACWALGGLLFMSVVPSKRLDRIFPIVPPLCLLLAGLARKWQAAHANSRALDRLTGYAVGLSILISGSYSVWRVVDSFRSQQRGLVAFGEKARELTAQQPERLAVVNGKDEGMLLYTGRTHFIDSNDAFKQWQHGEIDWLLLGTKDFEKEAPQLQPFEQVLAVLKLKEKYSGYVLLKRGS